MPKSKSREYFEMSEQQFSKLTKNELSDINKLLTKTFKNRLTRLLNTEGGKYSPALNSLYRIATKSKTPAYQKDISDIKEGILSFLDRGKTLNSERAYFAQMRQYLYSDETFSMRGWRDVFNNMREYIGDKSLTHSQAIDFWKAYDRILSSEKNAAMINYRENLSGVLNYKAVWDDIATYLNEGDSVDTIVEKMNKKIGEEYEKTREAEYADTLPPFITKRKI